MRNCCARLDFMSTSVVKKSENRAASELSNTGQ